jgi:hypothetical protein
MTGYGRATKLAGANALVLIRSAQLRLGKALNRLWLGNAGGAVVSISYLGAPRGSHAALWPLVCFLIGLW